MNTKNVIAVAATAICCLALSMDANAAEKYVGTVPAGSLNVTGSYDAGTQLPDGGCPTDGGGCWAPGIVQTFTATPGGAFSVQSASQGAGSICYCINQTDSSLLSNCDSTNCVYVAPGTIHDTSCPAGQTSMKIPAGTLSDGGTRYGFTNACTFYNAGDAGAKLFNLVK